GGRGVLGGGDAFQDQRDVVLVLEAPDVIPVQRRLVFDAGRRGAPRLDEALGDVALPPAVGGGVHREAERIVTGADRAADIVVHPGVVAAHVELEDARPVAAGRGTLLKARLGDGADDDR